PEHSLDFRTRLALVNALYFKGAWSSPFNPSATKDGSFFPVPGRAVSVPFMHQSETFAYGHQGGIQTLEMWYKGSQLAMDVLLPDQPNGLGALEQQLTSGHLTDLLANLSPHSVTATLPKFQVTATSDLTSSLSALGMPTAFDPSMADFSGMNGGRE